MTSSAPECYLAAFDYLQRGWCPIPINPRSKRPLVEWREFQTRLPTLEEIQTWWRKYPQAGVGIVTGKISKLVVVDFDSEEALQKIHEWPETYRVKTPKGAHLYYVIGDEHTPTNQGGIASGTHGPGIDSRGEGGYVVAPPTKRDDGGEYSYTSGELCWRPERCVSKDYEFKKLGPSDWATSTPEIDRAGAWIDEVLRDGVSTPGRNDSCARLAGVWAGKGVDESTAQILMLDWARKCRPPLSPEETATTVSSVYRTAERKAQAEQALANEPTALAESGGELGTAPLQLMAFDEFYLSFGSLKTEWLIEGWLPAATIMILVSPPGGFKSFLMAELASSIATGTEFLRTGKTPPIGKVLFCQQEDPHKMTAQRLALAIRAKLGLAIDSPWPEQVKNILAQVDRGMHFGNKVATRRLEEFVAQHRPKLVVLDPLYSMVDGKDHMVGAAVQMKILKGIRDRYGCSIIIVHHSSKSKFITLDRERAHGSQFLNAFVEGGFQTAKLSKGHIAIKRHFKAEEDQFAVIDWVINTKVDPPIYEPKATEKNEDEIDEEIGIYNASVRGQMSGKGTVFNEE